MDQFVPYQNEGYDIAGTTDDGYQTTFQTNTLAPAYLTELLLPHTSNDFRMVNVSSEMAKMVWNSTRKEGRAFPPVDGGDGMWDYALSKACQGLHAHGLNLRWAAENEAAIASEGGHDVVLNRRRAFAVEPGIVNTGISRHMQSWTRKLNYLLLAPIVRTLDEGTSTILFCLLAPRELLEDKGAEKDELGAEPFYYGECMAKPPPRCCQRREDAELQDKLFKDIFLPLGSYICKGINRVDQT